MMKKILYTALLIFGFGTYADAQIVLDNMAEVSGVAISREKSQLTATMTLDLTKVQVKSNREVRFTPRLVKGDQVKNFPAVVLSGRKNLIYRARNEKYFINEDLNLLLKKDKKGAQLVDYSFDFPFEPWFDGADFVLVSDDCGCAATLLTSNEMPLEKFTIPLVVLRPVMTFLEPVGEIQKSRSVVAEAFLDFPVNKYVIMPQFRNNHAELNKIKASIAAVAPDEDISIESVKLTGHSSPEGSYAINDRLARLRTDALKNYLVANFPKISARNFMADHVAENWDGLIKLLNASTTFAYKDELLNMINSTPDLDERERKMRTMDGGRAFRILAADFFPTLRNTKYEINYIIRKFTLEEAKELVWSNPQKLSLEEIYAVTEIYETDSPEYGELFEIAVRLFPQDVVANLNASTSALSRKDTDAAKRYLDRIPKESRDGLFYNNLGVYYMLIENYELAANQFEKAAVLGSIDAAKNYEMTNLKIEEIELFRVK